MSSEHLEVVAVPLSEHEQRMLAEIESALYAEDPKFASSVRKTGASGRRRPTALVVVLGVVGVALLVGGMTFVKVGGFPVFSLIGFLIMFAAGVLAMRSTPSSESKKTAGAGRGRSGGRSAPKSASGDSYSSRMEDRFRRRFEQ